MMRRRVALRLLVVLVVLALVLLVVPGHRPEQEAATVAEISEVLAGIGAFGTGYFVHSGGPDLTLQTPKRLLAIPRNGLLEPRALRLLQGWIEPDPHGLWAIGATSLLGLKLDTVRERVLELRCRSREVPEGSEQRQSITVELNGTACGSQEVGQRQTTLRFSLPESAQLRGENRLRLRYGFHRSDSQLGTGDDRTQWAVHFTRISMQPAGDGSRWGSPGDDGGFFRLLERPALRHDSRRQRIFFSRSGRFVVPLQLPVAAREMTLAGELPESALSARSVLRVLLRGLDGSSTELLSLPSRTDRNGSRRFSMTAPVAAQAGSTCLLVIETTLESGPVQLELPTLRLEQPERPGVQQPATPLPAHRGDQSPPDIVVIILDAARADHLGCYGYHRPTTPNIDRLARESLVFENAFALVPNTTLSVPTMLTGLSFLEHGVVDTSMRLGERAQTLAERLREKGYHTILVTDTPNNSHKRGTGQGYVVYREAWRNDRPKQEKHDPRYLSEVAMECLAEAPDDQPVHLLLHYLPPHEPYRPGAEHDRFSDPEYRGPITGDHRTNKAMTEGALLPDDSDVQHLIDLYDGNLLRADHGVGMVLDALQQRPSWQRTVVLITADHGEAFFEHGQRAHNTNTYDEMLHVPFVLRVPRELLPVASFDTVQLVTLADIVPTLLGTIRGERFTDLDDLDGLDLLSRERGRRDRFFVARNGHRVPSWAVRTTRWKVMVSRAGTGELYDLETDPHELHNLVDSQEEVFAGLVKLLEHRLQMAPELTYQEMLPDLDDDERAMLKTLGYL